MRYLGTPLILCLLQFLSFTAKPQSLTFAGQFDGASWKLPEDIAFDDASNWYVVGLFEGTVDFDPGPGLTNLTAPEDGADIFIGNVVGIASLLGEYVQKRDR